MVPRLKAAGAIVVGKTNTPEFGAGGNTFNAVFGATRNPWNPALTCGGSSGGAAVALATGMGPLAQGSDLGGSLRTPAAFCGVVGFRTTPGLVPVYPRSWRGTRSPCPGRWRERSPTSRLMLSAMAGPDDRAPLSYDVDTRAVHGGGAAALGQGLARGLDARPRRAHPGGRRGGPGGRAARAASSGRSARRSSDGLALLRELNDIVLATRGLSMAALHADRLAEWRGEMQKGLVWNIEQGLGLTPEEIGRAEKLRTRPVAAGAALHGAVRPAGPSHRGGSAVSGGAALSGGARREGRSRTTRSGSSSRTRFP